MYVYIYLDGLSQERLIACHVSRNETLFFVSKIDRRVFRMLTFIVDNSASWYYRQ